MKTHSVWFQRKFNPYLRKLFRVEICPIVYNGKIIGYGIIKFKTKEKWKSLNGVELWHQTKLGWWYLGEQALSQKESASALRFLFLLFKSTFNTKEKWCFTYQTSAQTLKTRYENTSNFIGIRHGDWRIPVRIQGLSHWPDWPDETAWAHERWRHCNYRLIVQNWRIYPKKIVPLMYNDW